MFTKSLFALSLAAAIGASIPAAYADNGHGSGRDYRSEHRDHRDHAGDRRDFGRDRYAHERHDRYDRRDHYVRHDYRAYYPEPRGYVMAAPVFAPPPVLYSQPSGINLVFPIDLR
jgi:hypothetical protein